MNNIKQYITEKLKLNNNLDIYHYHPKDWDELRSLIEKLLKERGEDANLNDIDVSGITIFYNVKKHKGLFEGLYPHNIDISKWDVSNITDMRCTFFDCMNFNCDLSKWNTSNVTDMRCIFYHCTNFNCDLSNWDVSNVKNMANMFCNCYKFNSDLSNWDVSKVTDMCFTFSNCLKFKGKGLENWDTSNVTDMHSMFLKCLNFNCDLSNWDVSKMNTNTISMYDMFKDCKELKKIPSWYHE